MRDVGGGLCPSSSSQITTWRLLNYKSLADSLGLLLTSYCNSNEPIFIFINLHVATWLMTFTCLLSCLVPFPHDWWPHSSFSQSSLCLALLSSSWPFRSLLNQWEQQKDYHRAGKECPGHCMHFIFFMGLEHLQEWVIVYADSNLSIISKSFIKNDRGFLDNLCTHDLHVKPLQIASKTE